MNPDNNDYNIRFLERVKLENTKTFQLNPAFLTTITYSPFYKKIGL